MSCPERYYLVGSESILLFFLPRPEDAEATVQLARKGQGCYNGFTSICPLKGEMQ